MLKNNIYYIIYVWRNYMKKIPYGISDYEKLIRQNFYYVDKTMYLEELENLGDTLVFLRPRRFGKTLFTSMMGYYYDINSKDKFNELFKNKDKSNYDIMIEFKYIKKKEYKRSLLERLKNAGIEQLKEYIGLLDVSKLNLKKYLVIYVGSEIKVMEEIL